MELMAGSLVVFFVGGGLLIIVISILTFTKNWLSEWWATLKPLDADSVAILEKYFQFYRQLPDSMQLRFRRKMQAILITKEFVPRNMPEVTREMQVLISAAAVQLTLGLPYSVLSYFKRILVYPDDYYSQINRRYHKGEVNPRYGIIVLSWSNFVAGYANPTNALNLGLHEMAHALKIENQLRSFDDKVLHPEVYKKWNMLVEQELEMVKSGKECLFREYGCVNEHEFFSVAVENFFERPGDFRTRNPQLFYTLCQLLNQDPLMDYRPLGRRPLI
jgi:MtfA peptidase